jgi:CRP-like cAMP-binding protein
MKVGEKLLSSEYFKLGKSNQFIDWILELSFSKKIKKGEFLLQEGDDSDKIYYIEKGLIRIFRTSGDKEITTWFAKEGDFLTNATSFHYGSPSRENFEALEDCVVYGTDRKTYRFLIEKSSSFALFSVHELFHNLCEFENQCEFLRTLNAQERIEYTEKNYPYLLTRVKNKYLASFLNIETTYLSKLLKNKKASN